MKKIIPVLILLIILSGCSKIPAGMDKRTYEAGSSALEVIHKYNTADITFSEAEERIKLLYNRVNSLDLEGDEEDSNLIIKIQLMAFIAGQDPYDIENSLKDYLP